MYLVRRQRGFTIIELMVGMLIGLLIMAGVLSVYVSMLRSSSTLLGSSRLNQEMMTIMTIMANDIRRAGFWGSATFQQAENNPFGAVDSVAAADISALRVHSNGLSGNTADFVDATYHDDGTGLMTITAASEGSCIVYTYDASKADGLDNDNTPFATDGDDDDEEFGFRWSGDATQPLQMRTSNNTSGPNDCDNASGNWESVNDPNDIVITALNFDLEGSSCVTALSKADCYSVAPASGDRTVESRHVVITLTAQLADDPDVTVTLQQTVQVRNNLVRVRP